MGALPAGREEVGWAKARKRRAHHIHAARDGGLASLSPPYDGLRLTIA
jgi:hypothetical protein